MDEATILAMFKEYDIILHGNVKTKILILQKFKRSPRQFLTRVLKKWETK